MPLNKLCIIYHGIITFPRERESVGSVQLGQTLLLCTCTIPFSLGLAHFVLHVSFITSLRPSEQSLRNSLKHPFRRQRCLRVLILVPALCLAQKEDRQTDMDSWK